MESDPQEWWDMEGVAQLDLVDRMQHAPKGGKTGIGLLETFMEGADCPDAVRLLFFLCSSDFTAREHLMRSPEELIDPN
jgi:hypothetical protein